MTVGTAEENDAFLSALRTSSGAARAWSAMTSRHDHEHRVTKETDVEVDLVLDGRRAGVRLDRNPVLRPHARAARQARRLRSDRRSFGRLEVDSHHTVEDVGIVLGTAFKKALGDKAGVRRFASGLFPLDEALVQVAVDLSGRPFVVYEIDPVAEWIGTFDPQLAEEFWRGFAFAAGITLHLRSLSGKNGHHVIEASFKGVARACATRCGSRATSSRRRKGRCRALPGHRPARTRCAAWRGEFAAETVYDADPVGVARRVRVRRGAVDPRGRPGRGAHR